VSEDEVYITYVTFEYHQVALGRLRIGRMRSLEFRHEPCRVRCARERIAVPFVAEQNLTGGAADVMNRNGVPFRKYQANALIILST
jgi:hypothetical protein